MEKRLVLAIVLSMAVIMLFSWRNAERMREAQRRTSVARTARQAASPIVGASPTITAPQSILPEAAESTPTQGQPSPWDTLALVTDSFQEATCVIESDLYRVEMSNRGGVPVSWRLLQYQELFSDSRYLALRARRADKFIARLRVPPVARLENPNMLHDFLQLGHQEEALKAYRDAILNNLRDFLQTADYYLDREERDLYEDLKPHLEAQDSLAPADQLRCAQELVIGEKFYPASPLACRWGPNCWDVSVAYDGPTGMLRVDDQPLEVVYTAEGEDLRVSKIFTFRPDVYSVTCQLRVENLSDTEIAGKCRLTWQGGIARPSTHKQVLNSARVARKDGKIIVSSPNVPSRTADYVAIAKDALEDSTSATWMGDNDIETIWRTEQPPRGVRWVGIDSKYFLAAIVVPPHEFPEETEKTRGCVGLSRIPGQPVDYVRPAVGIDFPVMGLAPGDVQEYTFILYVGPKEGPLLRAVDEYLEDLAKNYWLSSVVSPIARLLLHLLKFFYWIVPNYGVGIILLTFLVRLLMYPLYHKQMASMKKMQALQPQISALKERYKDNPQELQRKTMEFYKEHKVNPMAGCLTMLPMMPIFIALWGTFNQSIELRGAPFVGWIQDLSQPDQAFFIPIADWIIPINILPLLYCVLILWSQSRQKIETPHAGAMKLLPLIFVVIFWSIASGVILYFVVSMTMDTVQRILMDKFGEGKVPAKAPAVSMPARTRKAAAPTVSTPGRTRKAASRGQSRRKR